MEENKIRIKKKKKKTISNKTENKKLSKEKKRKCFLRNQVPFPIAANVTFDLERSTLSLQRTLVLYDVEFTVDAARPWDYRGEN